MALIFTCVANFHLDQTVMMALPWQLAETCVVCCVASLLLLLLLLWVITAAEAPWSCITASFRSSFSLFYPKSFWLPQESSEILKPLSSCLNNLNIPRCSSHPSGFLSSSLIPFLSPVYCLHTTRARSADSFGLFLWLAIRTCSFRLFALLATLNRPSSVLKIAAFLCHLLPTSVAYSISSKSPPSWFWSFHLTFNYVPLWLHVFVLHLNPQNPQICWSPHKHNLKPFPETFSRLCYYICHQFLVDFLCASTGLLQITGLLCESLCTAISSLYTKVDECPFPALTLSQTGLLGHTTGYSTPLLLGNFITCPSECSLPRHSFVGWPWLCSWLSTISSSDTDTFPLLLT